MLLTKAMDAARVGVGFQRNASVVWAPFLPTPSPLWSRFYRRVDTQGCRRYSFRHSFRVVPQQKSHWAPQEEPEESSSHTPRYHPFEEMVEPLPMVQGETRLTDAEMARTIIEVNSKVTLLFSALINDEVQENIFWPELPYSTDEHGDIYFEVKDDEDILQTLIADDKLVQVFIGLDNIERLAEMELLEPSNVDFGLEEITNRDSDVDDDYEKNYVAILDDNDGDEGDVDYVNDDEDDYDYDDEDDEDAVSSEPFGDWTNYETMKSSHPMYFAKKMSEVVSSIHLDWMEQPPASLVIQGLLRPTLFEESSVARKPNHSEKMGKEDSPQGGTSFYKLDILNIHLVSTYGNQSSVKIEDFQKARPDVLAHLATKIISQLKSGGDKFVQALKSLCWRSKGLQVEEVYLSGLDSLGFDLRVCSGTQIQTLRFSFRTRAMSEYSAERQLHEILFPRIQNWQHQQQQQQQQEAHYKE